MKKMLLGVAVSMILTSCISSGVITGSGREAKGAFDITPGYTELSVENGIMVELVPSLTGEGFITADEEALPHVSIVEEKGRVKVSYVPFVTVQSKIKTVVTMPASDRLEKIDVSSAGKVTSARRLLGSTIEIDCSSAAEVELDLDAGDVAIDISSAARFEGNVIARNLDVELNSASNCYMSGSAEVCKVEANSAADFRGVELVCRKAEVAASSAAKIEIAIVEDLDADASSGGSVRYKGSPAILRRNTSSGGSVREIK